MENGPFEGGRQVVKKAHNLSSPKLPWPDITIDIRSKEYPLETEQNPVFLWRWMGVDGHIWEAGQCI